MKKIKYIQLEPEAVICDIDFQLMSAEERGVYWAIIFYLYSNNGKCKFDIDNLKVLCNCQNFEKIWRKISKKFQKTNGYLTHKRVTQELRRARKRLQAAQKAGLKGAKKRWAPHSDPNGKAIAKGSKRNVIEETEREQLRIRKDSIDPSTAKEQILSQVRLPAPSNTALHCPVYSTSLRPAQNSSPAIRMLNFSEDLNGIIRPRNQSDRTSFRNICNWLTDEIQAGKFTDDVLKQVLGYAREAGKGRSRNPPAVFTSILKRELGYKP